MARRPPRMDPQLPAPAPSAEKPGFEPMLPRARDAAGTVAAIRKRLAEKGCTDDERQLFAATLSETIGDPDRAVRMATVELLAGMAATTPQARDTLVPGLADEERTVRELAARHLGRTAAGGDETAAVAAVAELLKHREPTVRRAAAVALGRTAEAAAVGPLRAALTDAYPPTRTAAAYSLARLAPDSAPAVEDLIRLLLEDGHDPALSAAVTALTRLMPHAVPHLAEAAVPLAKRLRVTWSLLELIGPLAAPAVPVLAKQLDAVPSTAEPSDFYIHPEVHPASRVLAAIGPEADAAVPALAKLCRFPVAANALAAIKTAAAMAALAEQAVEIGLGKGTALSALAKFGSAAASISPRLVEALGLPNSLHDKIALIDALGRIGPAEVAVPVLQRLLPTEPELLVRLGVARALWRLGVREPDPLAEMLAVLRTPNVNEWEVSVVFRLLEEIAPVERAEDFLPLLEAWSTNWERLVTQDALRAARALGKAAAPLLPVLVERLRSFRVTAWPYNGTWYRAQAARETLRIVNDLAPPATAVERLVPFLAVREPDAFREVAGMLVAHGAEAEPAIPALEAAARLKQQAIREIAADALADIRRAVRAAAEVRKG